MVCVPGVIDSGFRPCRGPRWHRSGDAWLVRRAMSHHNHPHNHINLRIQRIQKGRNIGGSVCRLCPHLDYGTNQYIRTCQGGAKGNDDRNGSGEKKRDSSKENNDKKEGDSYQRILFLRAFGTLFPFRDRSCRELLSKDTRSPYGSINVGGEFLTLWEIEDMVDGRLVGKEFIIYKQRTHANHEKFA